jgi:hypothetical protein
MDEIKSEYKPSNLSLKKKAWKFEFMKHLSHQHYETEVKQAQ